MHTLWCYLVHRVYSRICHLHQTLSGRSDIVSVGIKTTLLPTHGNYAFVRECGRLLICRDQLLKRHRLGGSNRDGRIEKACVWVSARGSRATRFRSSQTWLSGGQLLHQLPVSRGRYSTHKTSDCEPGRTWSGPVFQCLALPRSLVGSARWAWCLNLRPAITHPERQGL